MINSRPDSKKQIVPLLGGKASLAPEQISQGSALHGTGGGVSLSRLLQAPASLVRQLLSVFRMLTSEVVLETRQLSEQGALGLRHRDSVQDNCSYCHLCPEGKRRYSGLCGCRR